MLSKNRSVSILGCGWLGKPLGTALLNSGYVVLGSTTQDSNINVLKGLGITPVLLQVKDVSSADVSQTFFNSEILIISLPHRGRSGEREEYIKQISDVVEASLRGKIRSILLISTSSVYPNVNRVVTELDVDVNHYIVKAEKIVQQSGIPTTVLRFSGLFGPGRHPGKFLAARRGLPGANIPVNLIHLDDCIEIIKRIIDNNIWNEVLNACADEHPTKKMFYSNAAIEIGLEPPVFLDDKLADYKIVSNERLKSTLSYNFIHRLS